MEMGKAEHNCLANVGKGQAAGMCSGEYQRGDMRTAGRGQGDACSP